MTEVKLHVPGTPQAQERPRFARHGHPYKSSRQRNNEKTIITYWQEAGRPFLADDQPYDMVLSAAWTRPDSHKTKAGEVNALGRRYPVPTYRDLDNIVKLYLDVMVGVGAIPDDRHLVYIRAHKHWIDPRIGEHVAVSFTTIDAQEYGDAQTEAPAWRHHPSTDSSPSLQMT